jgi:hypothetical protein
MNKNGDHLQFVWVRATITGGSSQTQTVQTEGDGTFVFWIAAGPPGSNSVYQTNCTTTPLQYQIAVTTPQGATDSDTYTVNYDGNCNNDGEFHFDFVKVR